MIPLANLEAAVLRSVLAEAVAVLNGLPELLTEYRPRSAVVEGFSLYFGWCPPFRPGRVAVYEVTHAYRFKRMTQDIKVIDAINSLVDVFI